jgi:spore coat protein CotH
LYRKFKKTLKKFFREILLYHNSSLEYRAKVLTLVIACNHDMSQCEEDLLEEMACCIYDNDEERADILVDTVKEYFKKIVTNNGLNFEDLLYRVEKETREVQRFSSKINIEMLKKFHACVKDEDDRIYQERVVSFLADLKERYQLKEETDFKGEKC